MPTWSLTDCSACRKYSWLNIGAACGFLKLICAYWMPKMYIGASVYPDPSGFVVGSVEPAGFGVRSAGGMPLPRVEKSTDPLFSAVYMVVVLVYGTNFIAESCGLTGPLYFGFGASVALPLVLNAVTFHGP